MCASKTNDAIRSVSESAFDFLERAVDELKKHPKYSVIHFAIAEVRQPSSTQKPDDPLLS